jgi:cobalt-zinc-cadmium efflux system outer membrane protein
MLKNCLWAAGLACSLLRLDGVEAQTLASGLGVQPVEEPELVALVRGTLDRHPQVLAAMANLDARGALEDAADRPLFNPELETSFVNSDTNDRVIALRQTIDRAGRRVARTMVAERERETAATQLAIDRRDIAVELLSTLADYWTARDLVTLGELRADLAQRFADMARQRFEAGDLVPQSRLNVAQLAYSQTRILQAGANADLAAAEQLLRALTLRGAGEGWPSLPTELPEIRPSAEQLDNLIADAPAVRIQQDRLAVAEANVELRDRERRANPTLSIVGGEEEDESMVGLSISMPLNFRNRYTYEVAAASAQRLAVERELANVTTRARARLQAAARRYQLIHQAWTEWGDVGEMNLSRQMELLERLWRAGELGLTEYLVQLNQTVETQASALRLRRDLWLAWFEWLAAAGEVGTWLDLPVEELP